MAKAKELIDAELNKLVEEQSRIRSEIEDKQKTLERIDKEVRDLEIAKSKL